MSDIVHFANSAIDRAIENLDHDAGAIYAPHIIEMLRDLKNIDFAAYIRKRERIKESRKVKITEFDRIICRPEIDEEQEERRKAWFFSETEPTREPVDPGELLQDMVTLLKRFVVADDATLCAAALWCAFTWFHDHFKTSPLAIITAPEMRAGKTILLLAMSEMVRRPLITSNISSGALVRCIDKYQPTLLVDEVDTFLKHNEEMRGIINAGLYKKNAYIVRCTGENFAPQVFATWAPKVLAGIGKLAPTIEDRAIRLVLRRKMIEEHVDNLSRTTDAMWQELRSRLARFCDDCYSTVADYEADPIEKLDNRANDCWGPLRAVAHAAGGEWPERARAAALKLTIDPDVAMSNNARLLLCVRQICEQRTDLISINSVGRYILCIDLLKALLEMDDEPWAQNEMNAYRVGCILKSYGIRSIVMRTPAGGRSKGFYIDYFKDAFARYLPRDCPI